MKLSQKKFAFIQARHIYAPKTGKGHIYLSAPLITFLARLHEAGVPVEAMRFVDENFDLARGKLEEAYDLGINLVGAPYIPAVIQLIKTRLRGGARAILGGQIIDKLSDEEFQKLFQTLRDDVEVVKGDQRGIQDFFEVTQMPKAEEVSSIPIWEQIPDEQMYAYLSREISFYLAQGCIFNCSFCQAAKGQKESYRNLDLALADLRWLTEKSRSMGIFELPIYLSNLDLFQNPKELEAFLAGANEIAKSFDFQYRFRGLATVQSVTSAEDEYLVRCSSYGLDEVGIGIDGATPQIWKRTKKFQNISQGDENEDHEKCIRAIEKIHGAGMIPEMLMVLGHDGGDLQSTIDDMLTAKEFVKEMRRKYKVKVHPYLVKPLLPGTDAWREDENQHLVEELIAHPEHFTDLDFAASPNRFSHPDEHVRNVVRSYYLEFMRSIACMDELVYSSEDAAKLGISAHELNLEKYDR